MHRRVVALGVGVAVMAAGVGVVVARDGGARPDAAPTHSHATTSPASSPVPSRTKPSLPPRTVVRVPWSSAPYDADRPPAFPGTVPKPHIPWCAATDLHLMADWQGATGNLFGAATVTNTSIRACAVQGQPSVAVLDRPGDVLIAAEGDPFYVDAWVRLAPKATASSQVDWYGEFCHTPRPRTLRLTLPHHGGVLRTSMRESPPCQADSDPPSAGQLQLHGFIRRSGNTVVARYTPEASLGASVGRVHRRVLAGNDLHYRVRLYSFGTGQIQLNPCLPYREQLVTATGAVAVQQSFLLDCDPAIAQPDTPQSGFRNFYAMRMHVPASLPPGHYALRWQSVLEPVQDAAGTRVVVIGAPAPCTQEQLRITAGVTGAGMGSFYAPVVFRNVSATTCSLRGYPGVEYVDPHGAGMPTHAEQDTSITLRTVPLEPGKAAAATLSGSDYGPNGGATPCPATGGVRVIAPGLTTQVFVRVGVDYCHGGQIFVTPVQPGAHPRP